MDKLKEEDLKSVVSMKMSIIEKVAGVTTSRRIRLAACSTTAFDAFYPPRKSARSDVDYLKEFRPLYCVQESTLRPQDTTLSGDGRHRHDNYKQMVFEVG